MVSKKIAGNHTSSKESVKNKLEYAHDILSLRERKYFLRNNGFKNELTYQ